MTEPTVVVLDRGDSTTISVHLFGGNITSWKIHNKEQLFLSRITRLSELEGVLGGFCFSFPHSGQWNFGPQFGFLKNIMWSLEIGPHYLENGDVWAKFSTKDDAYTRSFWNFSFKISYIIILQERSLCFDIKVENPDKYFFCEFTCILMSFLKLAGIKDCDIVGLEEATVKTRAYKNQDKDSTSAIDCLEVMYTNVEKDVYVTNTHDHGAMKITASGEQDFFVFNPKYGEIPFNYIGKFSLNNYFYIYCFIFQLYMGVGH